MRPLPNLQDVPAMAARGRRSALYSARKEACEQLRDAASSILHAEELFNVDNQVERARQALDRLVEIGNLMEAEQ